MNRLAIAIAALVAAGTALLATLALAGPAAARSKCPRPRSARAGYLVSPCNGATIARGSRPVFTAVDRNSQARRYHPFINIQTKRVLRHGHLRETTDPNGDIAQMNPAGHGRFTYKTKSLTFAGYWAVTPGTYYVQIKQVDDRSGANQIYYGPIITIHVA